MNALNERRFLEVKQQFFDLRPQDVTPTTDFNVEPQYTLISHLPKDINAQIKAFSDELQRDFPAHYYYAPEQYHLTIVPVPASVKPEQAIARLQPILKGWRLPIHVFGFAANRFQASAVLYPEEETLVEMRARLRIAIGIPDQAYTEHRNIWEELLWANFMRFTATPQDALIKRLQSKAADDVGHFVLDHFELYAVSTKTLDSESSRLLHTFTA